MYPCSLTKATWGIDITPISVANSGMSMNGRSMDRLRLDSVVSCHALMLENSGSSSWEKTKYKSEGKDDDAGPQDFEKFVEITEGRKGEKERSLLETYMYYMVKGSVMYFKL